MTFQDPNRATPPTDPAHPADPADAPTVSWTPPPTIEGAPPTPSEPVRRPAGRNRLRWGVALVVTVLVAVAGVAGAMLLTGQSAAPSTIAGYAPADSVAYGELRLDLPGDQREQLSAFLSKFPGFADQATFDQKLDDVLDRVVRAASDGRQDWTTNVKPWFGGQLGFSVSGLPTPGESEMPRYLLVLSVKDADRAQAWFNEVTADLPRSEGDHNGAPLTLFGEGGKAGAMTIRDGTTMLVGDQASVQAAVDTGGRSKFATEGKLRDALASVEGEGLGFVYLDLKRYIAWFEEAAVSMGGATAAPLPPATVAMLPDWMIFRAQARGDSLAFETASPHSDAIAAATKNAPGVIAGHLPASTIAMFEGHEVGATILKAIENAKQDPEIAKEMAPLEQQIALIGGLDGVFGWWGDSALAVARDGDGVHGGLVIKPTSAEDANRFVGVIRAGLQLAGGSQVTVREEDHAGTKITIVDVGDLASLAPMLGLPGGLPAAGGVPGERVELAFASTPDVVVLGIGPSFVRAVLDAGAGSSLADDARYQALLAKVGAENLGTTFVDIAAIRELVEKVGAQNPALLAEYERDVKPYLLPLDAIVGSTRLDGDIDRGLTLVTVK